MKYRDKRRRLCGGEGGGVGGRKEMGGATGDRYERVTRYLEIK